MGWASKIFNGTKVYDSRNCGAKIFRQKLYLPVMKFIANARPLLICLGTLLLIFVIASLLDIILAVLYARFYSNAAFIVLFGVGGVFAGLLGYINAINLAPDKNETTRWSIIMLIVLVGLLFFFLLAKLEGGEYEAAFKSYGATMAVSAFFFSKGKID
jgi:hypothetical protein